VKPTRRDCKACLRYWLQRTFNHLGDMLQRQGADVVSLPEVAPDGTLSGALVWHPRPIFAHTDPPDSVSMGNSDGPDKLV
jgi:hypothetical protein